MPSLRTWSALMLLAAVGCERGPATALNGTDSTISANRPAGPAWFEDVTAARGITFRHDAGPVGSYALPQVMGSGGALFDADNDGRLDVYLIHNAGPGSAATNRLYLQQPDGRFRDASAGSGLDVAGYGMGTAAGDVDNDGKVDLVLTEHGRTRLFVNQGAGKFRDAAQEAGIDNPLWATAAAFLDYDRDGWLDLVVVNYVAFDPAVKCGSQSGEIDFCNPAMYKGTVDRLYRNLGAKSGTVRFEDATVRSGLAAGVGPGLGVVCADLTGDGWIDIFVANDGQPNRLWVNKRNGTFVDEAGQRGVALNGTGGTAANMGVACGDVDGDGRLDLFVTHLGEEMHSLWRQDVDGFFRDQTASLGLAGGQWRGTGFGTVLADFDRDGWPDLVLANGRVAKRRGAQRDVPPERFWEPYHDRNQLFVGTGGGKFRDASANSPALCERPNVARAAALGDIDNDGAPDLLVTEIAGPARLLRNVAPTAGHWLGVRALDPKFNRDSLGSTVTVRAGGRTIVGLVNPAGSYLCASDPRVHFGLGSTTTVDEVTVRWWDGSSERFTIPAVDRYVDVRKGEGTLLDKGDR